MIRITIIALISITSSYYLPAQKEYSQNYFGNYFFHLKNFDYKSASDFADKVEDVDLKKELIQLSEILYQAGQKKIDLLERSEGGGNLLEAISKLRIGYYHLYTDPYSKKPFENFNQAYEIGLKINHGELKKFSLISILEVYNFEISQSNDDALGYLEKLEVLVSDNVDDYHYRMHLLHFYLRDLFLNIKVDRAFFKEFDIVMSNFNKRHPFWGNYYSSKGNFLESLEDYDDSIELHEKAIAVIKDEPFLKYIKFRSYIRLAEIMRKRFSYDKALQFIKKAEDSKDLSDSIRSNYYLKRYSSLNLFGLKEFERAYETLRLSNDLKDKLEYQKNTLEIAHLNMRYKTQEKELALMKEKDRVRKNKNWALALGSLLLFGGLLAFLIHKNTKRKQLLAEQEKIVQEQKVENLLKEQELTTIDAMIEGQEKERIRIANDLHDDLGGLMANVKLHFNSLQEKNKEEDSELYGKTDKLLDEAYEKIRAIAHAKNSGVIANQGLLKAVYEMAEKISSANKINIDVIDHGLTNRLENSLELTLFRTVQELITNVIKHANATEATVHLTNHEDVLNIMVEDNGEGFRTEGIISKGDGMGLKNIDKRMAHLGGTFNIESQPGKGTTVIIDVPI